MLSGRVHVRADGIAHQPGVDLGTMDPILLGINRRSRLALFHCKGTNYWSARSRAYAPSEMMVGKYESIELGKDGGFILIGVRWHLDQAPTTRATAQKIMPDIIKDIVEEIRRDGN